MRRATLLCLILCLFGSTLFCFETEQTASPESLFPIGLNFDTEYCRKNLLEGRNIDYYYTSAEVTIPWKSTELVFQIDKLDYDINLLYDNYYGFRIRDNKAGAVLRFYAGDGLYVGLGANYRDESTGMQNGVYKTQALHLEMGANSHPQFGNLSWKAYYEEDVNNDRNYSSEYMETQFYDIGKDMGFYEHLGGFELNILNSSTPQAKVFTTHYPLTFLPEGSAYTDIDVSFNGRFGDKKDYQSNAFDVAILQGKAAQYYKLSDILEVNAIVALNLFSYEQASEKSSSTSSRLELGMLFDLIQYKDLHLGARTSFQMLGSTSTHEGVGKSTESHSSSDPFIIPSVVMGYKILNNVALNGCLSRTYYGKQSGELVSVYSNRNWDGSLAMSVRF